MCWNMLHGSCKLFLVSLIDHPGAITRVILADHLLSLVGFSSFRYRISAEHQALLDDKMSHYDCDRYTRTSTYRYSEYANINSIHDKLMLHQPHATIKTIRHQQICLRDLRLSPVRSY